MRKFLSLFLTLIMVLSLAGVMGVSALAAESGELTIVFTGGTKNAVVGEGLGFAHAAAIKETYDSDAVLLVDVGGLEAAAAPILAAADYDLAVRDEDVADLTINSIALDIEGVNAGAKFSKNGVEVAFVSLKPMGDMDPDEYYDEIQAVVTQARNTDAQFVIALGCLGAGKDLIDNANALIENVSGIDAVLTYGKTDVKALPYTETAEDSEAAEEETVEDGEAAEEEIVEDGEAAEEETVEDGEAAEEETAEDGEAAEETDGETADEESAEEEEAPKPAQALLVSVEEGFGSIGIVSIKDNMIYAETVNAETAETLGLELSDTILGMEMMLPGADAAEEADGEAAEETDGEAAEETDGETAEETDGEAAEETDGETAEEADGEAAEKTDGEAAEKTDGETEEKTDGEAAEETDGETEEKTDGEAAEETDGETEEKTDGEAAEETDGETEEKTDGETEEKTDGEAAEKTDGEAEEKTDGETEEKTDGETEEKTDGETEEKTDGEADEGAVDETDEENKPETDGEAETLSPTDGAAEAASSTDTKSAGDVVYWTKGTEDLVFELDHPVSSITVGGQDFGAEYYTLSNDNKTVAVKASVLNGWTNNAENTNYTFVFTFSDGAENKTVKVKISGEAPAEATETPAPTDTPAPTATPAPTQAPRGLTPATGDTSPIALYAIILGVMIVALIVVIVLVVRKKKNGK